MKISLAFLLVALTIVSAGVVDRQLCVDNCITGCPAREICAWDGLSGCQVCAIPGLDPVIFQKRQDCFPVLCKMFCINGWATDSTTGCEICQCA